MPRMLVVWCPDWPVVAAGAPPAGQVAVVHANRVVACSPAARSARSRPAAPPATTAASRPWRPR